MAAWTASRPIGQQLLFEGLATFAEDCESALPAEDFEWGLEHDEQTAREQLLAGEALWAEAEGQRMGMLAAYVAMSIAAPPRPQPQERSQDPERDCDAPEVDDVLVFVDDDYTLEEIPTDIDSEDEAWSELGDESEFESFNGVAPGDQKAGLLKVSVGTEPTHPLAV